MADETPPGNIGTIFGKSLQEEMQTSYMEYAMSVIISRALPEVRDGLKPVQRRILYAMQGVGATSGARYRKCAAYVGDVLKLYHPHSDTAVYDALVRMAQDFSLRYPLIDGQGNFGSVDGDRAAAMRYTEARMSAIAGELLADIEKNTVDMEPNYDGTEEQPTVLPARVPNLLINGATGIAVGMTTNIPPHNLREVCSAVTHLVENPEASAEDLLQFVKGPHFPTGGIIMGTTGIKQAYATGHGKIVVRARHTFEEASNGRERIIFDELPYAVNKANLVAKMAELANDKKLEGIADLRDESGRDGMRLVVELKRDARPFTVLNNLYKHTALQSTFGVIMLAIVDARPVVLSLKQALQLFIDHRRAVIVRRTQFDLEKAQERAHILEGLKIALDHLDEVIKTIRGAADTDTASDQLQSRFGLSERQAKAILALTLGRLTQLERKKIDEEYEDVIKTIAYLESILASDQKVRMLIADEMAEMIKKYGDDRRTEITDQEAGELSAEDLIPKEDANVRRNGLIAINLQDGDELNWVSPTSGSDEVIIATQLGKAIRFSEGEVRPMGRDTMGVIGMRLGKGDAVAGMAVARDHADLLVVTERGYGKRTPVAEYPLHHRGGQGVFTLKVTDRVGRLATLRVTHDPEEEVLLITASGMVLRTTVGSISQIGRQTQGVIVMRVQADDQVITLAPVGLEEEERPA